MNIRVLLIPLLFLMMFLYVPGSFYPLLMEKQVLFLFCGVIFLFLNIYDKNRINKSFIGFLLFLIPLNFILLKEKAWYQPLEMLYFISFVISGYMIFVYFKNIRKKKWVYKALFIVFFLEKILFLLQKNGSLILGNLQGRNALTGSIGNANLCSFIFVVSIAFSFFLYKEISGKSFQYFLVFDIFLSILSIVISSSRSGFLGMLVLILSLSFIGFEEKRKKGIVILSCIALSYILFDRFSINDSVLQRIFIWKVTFTMFLDNPFLGVGPGNFKNAFYEYYGSVIRTEYLYFLPENTFAMHSHNEILQMIAEAGSLLLIIGLVMLRKSRGLFAFCKRPLVLSFMVIALFDFPFHNPAVSFFFLVVLGSMEWQGTVPDLADSRIKPTDLSLTHKHCNEKLIMKNEELLETEEEEVEKQEQNSQFSILNCKLHFFNLILIIVIAFTAMISLKQFLSYFYLSKYLYDEQDVKNLDRSIRLYDNPESRYFRSIEHYRNKEVDEAIEDLSYSLSNTYELPPYLFAIDLFIEYEQYEKAQEYALEAYKINPYELRILKRLEILYEKLDYVEESEKFRKKIELILKYRKTRRNDGIMEIFF